MTKMRSRARRAGGEQSGQAIALVVVFMFSLLGMSAAAIDVGYWYQEKRSVQAQADAAALAGASELPAGWSNAQAAALSQVNKNKKPGDVAAVTNTTNGSSLDSVTVQVTRQAPSFFAKVFGIDDATIRAEARATVRSVTTLASNFDTMPWAVPRNSFVPGQPYAIYTDSRNNANNGAVSLPYQSGTNCPTPNGANPYRDEIAGTLNACHISNGQVIDLKPGNNTGPTAQGLNQRISTWKPWDQVVTLIAGNQYRILDNSTRQLVLIPVVTNLSGGTTWPNGAGQVRVVSFAWFVITSCGNPASPTYCRNSDGGQVNGVFVGLQDSDSNNGLGNWDPSAGGTTFQIELTL